MYRNNVKLIWREREGVRPQTPGGKSNGGGRDLDRPAQDLEIQPGAQ